MLEGSCKMHALVCVQPDFYQDNRIFPRNLISKYIVSFVCLSLATPLDGDWSQWGPWTQCSQTCGITGGTILRRSRLCNQPPPMNGGQHCPGNDTETARACFTPCPGKFASRVILWIQNRLNIFDLILRKKNKLRQKHISP